MAPPPLLVTAFEPFGDLASNPSEAVLARLPPRVAGHPVRRAVLPVDSLIAPAQLRGLLDVHQPCRLLLLGVAPNRAALCPERQARNLLDFRIPDNGGHQPRARPIVPGAPNHLPTTWPLDPMLEAAPWGDAPVRPSDDAGEFLCNLVYYHALRIAPPTTLTLFVHLPPDDRLAASRKGGPCVPLGIQTPAILAMLTFGLGDPAPAP
ncbi:MAG: pyroglutamyl-peptidase I [Deltaproteobacteria bacterium]|nr:MAG: pyroglutamyl-peptidase I [Deltaproteobacteria bacterium]